MTTPVVTPTVATDAQELYHVPPATALVKVVVEPVQTVEDPPIAPGVVFTVKTAVTRQPVPNE